MRLRRRIRALILLSRSFEKSRLLLLMTSLEAFKVLDLIMLPPAASQLALLSMVVNSPPAPLLFSSPPFRKWE
jgi:hypothetical protein